MTISMSPTKYQKLKKKLKSEYQDKYHRIQERKNIYKNTKEFKDQFERFMDGGRRVHELRDGRIERAATDCDIMETVN